MQIRRGDDEMVHQGTRNILPRPSEDDQASLREDGQGLPSDLGNKDPQPSLEKDDRVLPSDDPTLESIFP